MIDIFRTRTARSTIDSPIRIEGKQISELPLERAALRFSPVYPFTRVFDHLTIGWYELLRINTPAMDSRSRQLQCKTSISRVDAKVTIHGRCVGSMTTPHARQSNQFSVYVLLEVLLNFAFYDLDKLMDCFGAFIQGRALIFFQLDFVDLFDAVLP